MQLQTKITARTDHNLVALSLLLVSASTLVAQSVGTFTRTGSMTVPRTQHTATLLVDGRVLIAGGAIGWNYGPATATAEVYDPSTGIFTPTGSMASARSSHTATLLADGRVLIVGSGVPHTAELYDPSTGVFSTTGNLPPTQSSDLATTLLNDGRVLVIGYAGADLYDPSSGIFTPAGPRLTAGMRRPVLLPDGGVLLMATPGNAGLAIELYNPRTNTFSVSKWPFVTSFFSYEDTAIPVGYTAASANLLRNGAVLVTLQSLDGSDSYWAVLYDFSTGTFTQTGLPLLFGRNGQSGTSLSDATVLITGGVGKQCGSVGTPSPLAEAYDPVSGEFSAMGSMTTYRDSYAATLLRSGEVLIAGGMGCPIMADGKYSPLATAELYRPASAAPPAALLSLSGDGRGPGAVQHADTYEVVSASRPAAAGEILAVFCAGLAEGSVIPPQVSIGGKMAEILWFGNTPGYVGLNQINVRVPVSVAPGPAVPLHLTYIGRSSNEVTIGVR